MKAIVLLLVMAITFQSCSRKEYNCERRSEMSKSRAKMIKKLNRTYNYKPYKQWK